MYVVTVRFTVRPDVVTDLKTRVVQQAAETLQGEPACRAFDVCFDPDDDTRVFLYQVYEAPEDYLAHLETDEFKSFETDTAGWVAEREVHTYRRL